MKPKTYNKAKSMVMQPLYKSKTEKNRKAYTRKSKHKGLKYV